MSRPPLLHIFSKYRQFGGEEACFHAAGSQLQQLLPVQDFVYSTQQLQADYPGKLAQARAMLRNRRVEQSLQQLLRQQDFSGWLIHNTFPAMSPAVYKLALQQQVPVIHYVHNYRPACLNGLMLRQGKICSACAGGAYGHGVIHGCWHGMAQSAVAALALHKTFRMGVWHKLAAYVAVSRRQRDLLVAAGLPAEKVHVIPHCITLPANDPPPAPDLLWSRPRPHVLFIGRLAPGKGVLELLQAWAALRPANRTLYIVGTGPLQSAAVVMAASLGVQDSVQFCGFLPPAAQAAIRARCGLCVVPSFWHETFGMTVLESWLHAAPVLVSPMGGLPELINSAPADTTPPGFIMPAPTPAALQSTLARALQDHACWQAMGRAGHALTQSLYSPAAWRANMQNLLRSLSVL